MNYYNICAKIIKKSGLIILFSLPCSGLIGTSTMSIGT